MKKDLLIRFKELLEENRSVNLDLLLKEKNKLNNDLKKIENDLKKYKIEYINTSSQNIIDKYNNKNKKNIIALIIGIPALLGLSLLSNAFVYLLFCYVVANCVMINMNEIDKLHEVSLHEEDKEYSKFRKDMSNGIFRVDVMELELKKDVIVSKIKEIDRKLSKYRSNVSEIDDIKVILSGKEEKDQGYIKRK